MLQFFEVIFTEIPQVIHQSQLKQANEPYDHKIIAAFLQVFNWIGTLEYQSKYNADGLPPATLNFHIIDTLLVIFLTIVQQKAWSYKLHRRHSEQKKVQEDADFNAESTKKGKTAMAQGLMGILSRAFGYANKEEFKREFLDFLPIAFLWVFRFSLLFIAYMYNSIIGFFYLVMVIVSFLLLPHHFYWIAAYFVVPITLFQYCLLYVFNVDAFGGQGQTEDSIYTINPWNEYAVKFSNATLELVFLYGNLIVVFFMIPAKIRLDNFRSQHKNKDIGQEFFDRKIDNEKHLGWGLFFTALMNLHTLVLFMLVFIGSSGKFTLFNVLSMFLFVIFSAFDNLYRSISIVLPIFVGFFITG